MSLPELSSGGSGCPPGGRVALPDDLALQVLIVLMGGLAAAGAPARLVRAA
jgi:hypothetical protein